MTTKSISVGKSSSSSQNYQYHSGTLSSAALENRLHILREKSNELSQTLTQRLATSQSGQNLLHIGPSLSTLPPDLHSMKMYITPLHEDIQLYEQKLRVELQRVVDLANSIRVAKDRSNNAKECADLYQDLLAAEGLVKKDLVRDLSNLYEGKDTTIDGTNDIDYQSSMGDIIETGENNLYILNAEQNTENTVKENDKNDLKMNKTKESTQSIGMLDHLSSLERTAHITLHLIQALKYSTDQASSVISIKNSDIATNTNKLNLPSLSQSLPRVNEKSQYLMKLAPRIRRLESDVVKCLVRWMEYILGEIGKQGDELMKKNDDEKITDTTKNPVQDSKREEDRESYFFGCSDFNWSKEQENILGIGHCLRGLALLGRGREAESTFARVAVAPIIRSKLSMGKLDEGGARGQCAGLFSLLDDLACTITKKFGSILRSSVEIFDVSTLNAAQLFPSDSDTLMDVDVDLVSAGVWLPLAATFMADSSIQMAVFSPGIATILQANYTAFDIFLSELAERLLSDSSNPTSSAPSKSQSSVLSPFFTVPIVSKDAIASSQKRIYRHSITSDFSKKWNLPIYYQLRFGENSARLSSAITKVQRDGWHANVFSGPDSTAKSITDSQGFEVSLFIELYDIIAGLWKANVLIRPLTHRFLRGALQMIGRIVHFVKEGIEGKVKFGEKDEDLPTTDDDGKVSSSLKKGSGDEPYLWAERIGDVATVAWELTVLEAFMIHDYPTMIEEAVIPQQIGNLNNICNTQEELDELKSLVPEMLLEAAQDIGPLIEYLWDEIIVNILIKSCSGPLAAVKGVAATYRMTNRPPPTHASPFVSMILRPLREFDENYSSRTPPQVGNDWKLHVVRTIAEKYSLAVEDLLETVKRTEVALKNRKARRFTSGGMSDGEKVKLQLYLDYKEFVQNVSDVGIDVAEVEGVLDLATLTAEAASLTSEISA